MSRSCVCLVILLLTFPVPGQAEDDAPPQGKPKLFVEQTEIDIGTIREGDIGLAIFKLKNIGDAPLKIVRVKAGCSCTIPKLDDTNKIIQPGETRDLPISYKTKNRSGFRKLTITLMTNDPDAPKTTLRLAATVEMLVQILPNRYVNFATQRRGEQIRRVIDIMPGKDDASLEILELSVEDPGITFTKEDFQSGSRKGWRIRFSIVEDVALGPINTRATGRFRVGDEEQSIEIPINGTIAGSLSYRPQKISWFPPARGGQRLTPIAVKSEIARAFEIRKVVVPSQLEAQTKAKADGREHEIQLTVKGDAPTGPFGGYVDIYTSSTEQPIIRIPVYANIAPAVDVEPCYVLLRMGGGKNVDASRKIVLQGERKKNLVIENVQSDKDFVKAEVVDTGSRVRDSIKYVRVWIDGSPSPGTHDATLTVSTNLTPNKPLTIPVSVEVE